MGNNSPLENLEEYILLAVAHLGAQAYGVTVRETVENALKKSISVGVIYTTLERLEEKGYVASRKGESTSERGGRAKRYFMILEAGQQALADAERARLTLRMKLQSVGV